MSYKAAIIGTGGIAGMGILGMHDEEKIGHEKIRASHAGGYEQTDEVELVGVADIDEEKLQRFGKAWEIPEERRYIGHNAMLEEEDLDVVSVCTPSYLHHDHVIDVARSSANPDVIWCEKPIASQVNNAEEMVAVCDETDTELLVNHSFRFTDKLQRLKHLINEKDIIGDIHSVSMQFRMELLRNSTHLLDTLVYLFDAHANQIAGFINGENGAIDGIDVDTSVADSGGGGFVVMDDGTFVTVDCTIPRDISSMTLSFIGTEGKVYLNNDDGEWRYWSLENGDHVERPLSGIEGAWTWDCDYKNSFANAADHVEALLRGQAVNHSTGREAIRSLEIIIGFYISHYTNGMVSLPLDPPLKDVRVNSW